MTAEPRAFLEADICLWCGNYSCTCEDALDSVARIIEDVLLRVSKGFIERAPIVTSR